MVRKKRALWRNYKRIGSGDSYKVHRTFSNQISTDIKKTRIADSNDTKRLFKHIRTKLKVPIQIRDNSDTLTNDSGEVANILADIFSIVFTREFLDVIPNVLGPPNPTSLSEVDFPECATYKVRRVRISCA